MILLVMVLVTGSQESDASQWQIDNMVRGVRHERVSEFQMRCIVAGHSWQKRSLYVSALQ